MTDKRSIKERLTDLPKTKAISEDGINNNFQIRDQNDESERVRMGTFIELFNTTNILIDVLEMQGLRENEVKNHLTSN